MTKESANKDEIILSDFKERVRHLIKLYDSYADFGREIGVSRQVPTMIMSGDIKNISFVLLHKIVKGTGCDPEWLVTGKGAPFKNKTKSVKKKQAFLNLDDVLAGVSKGAKDTKDKVKFIKSIRDLCEVYLDSLGQTNQSAS